MMKKTLVGLLASITIAVNTTGCSYIKSQFPDKAKDYQFTTEIPALQIPEDLQEHAIKEKSTIPKKSIEDIDYSQIPESDYQVKSQFTPVELLKFDGGATRLRIEEPMSIAWRRVGQALSNQSIEIIDRDDKQFFYVVQYDPDAKKIEDGSLWDEFTFLFGKNPAQEKEFRISLSEKNQKMTEVIVLDEKDKPTSQGNGLRLLKLLKTTINKDLATQ